MSDAVHHTVTRQEAPQDAPSSAASSPANAVGILLPVVPLPLIRPLLTIGKAACGALQGIGPYSLSLASAVERSAIDGGGIFPSLSSSLPFLLPAARSALYQVACSSTSLLAYPSVQYPFVAQSVWPSLVPLLPQPAALRAAAHHFVSDVLLGASVSEQASASGALTRVRDSTVSLSAAASPTTGVAVASPHIEAESLQYLAARRRGRALTSLPSQADSHEHPQRSEFFHYSSLALRWLHGLASDVLMVVASLVDYPKADGSMKAASLSNTSALVLPSPSPASGRTASPSGLVGACCGDFLRGKLREVVFPCVLAALQSEVAIAAAAATIDSSTVAGHAVSSLSSTRSARKRLLYASLKVILALAKPCATIPRDDDDAEDASKGSNWKPPAKDAQKQPSEAAPSSEEWKPLPAVMPLSFTSTSGGTEDADEGAWRRRLQLSPAARKAVSERNVNDVSKQRMLSDSCVYWSSPVLNRGETSQLLACLQLLRRLPALNPQGSAPPGQAGHLGLGALLEETERVLAERIAGTDD
jgi:hypothetical protein